MNQAANTSPDNEKISVPEERASVVDKALEVDGTAVKNHDVQDASESAPDNENSIQSSQQSSANSVLIWVFLLLMIAVGGLLLVPNPWQAKVHHGLDLVRSWWQPVSVQRTVQGTVSREQPSSLPSDALLLDSLPPNLAPVAHVAPQVEATPPMAGPSLSPHQSENVVAEAPISEPSVVEPPVLIATVPVPKVAIDQRLGQQIDQLNRQLQRVASSQQHLAQQQKTIANAALRQQIAFLSSPSTGLQQMVWAWQGVVQLSGLDDQARHRAQAIATEAERLLVQRRQWQQLLQQVAKELRQSVGRHGFDGQRLTLHDISAIEDSAFTHWLDQQFTLYHLPTAEEQRKNHFARTLGQIAAAMDHERWPSAEVWRSTRQQIGYWLDPARIVSLPKGFDGVRQQWFMLRQQQAAWLKEVQ